MKAAIGEAFAADLILLLDENAATVGQSEAIAPVQLLHDNKSLPILYTCPISYVSTLKLVLPFH